MQPNVLVVVVVFVVVAVVVVVVVVDVAVGQRQPAAKQPPGRLVSSLRSAAAWSTYFGSTPAPVSKPE